jgi:malate dehydrogenase (oxaloacetate-decarboxylating)
MAWTNGTALIATGTPYPDVSVNGRRIRIGQCNNAFIFPGLALGAIVAKASKISDGMISAAGIELANWMPTYGDPNASLMPVLDDVLPISHRVGIAVALAAMREGLAERVTIDEIERRIEAKKWPGTYYKYRLPKGDGPTVNGD